VEQARKISRWSRSDSGGSGRGLGYALVAKLH
jgi:hypothetical protein